MRYIIIPLGIILYIWWTISSVRDIYNSDGFGDWRASSVVWLVVSVCSITLLSILYW